MALTKIPSELSSTTGIVDNSNATAITIDSNENVGIGTTTLSYKFQISDGTRTAIINPNSSLDGIFFGTKESKPLIIGTADNERMRIDASGNVGIGLNPSARLSIRPSGSGSEDSHFGFGANRDTYISTSSTGTIIFRNASERMRIDSSGRLLISNTSPNYSERLSVHSNGAAYSAHLYAGSGATAPLICRNDNGGSGSRIQAFFIYGSTTVGSITSTSTSTSYNTSSDYRLKENVVELTGATERLKQLNPSRFNFIADADTTVDGFLAHEVADVVPEAISGEKDAVDAEGNPEYQGIDQSKLVPLLVATIQELEARITELENN